MVGKARASSCGELACLLRVLVQMLVVVLCGCVFSFCVSAAWPASCALDTSCSEFAPKLRLYGERVNLQRRFHVPHR